MKEGFSLPLMFWKKKTCAPVWTGCKNYKIKRGRKQVWRRNWEIQLTGFQLSLLSQSSFFYFFFSVFQVVKSGEEPPLEFSPEMQKQIKRSKIFFIFTVLAKEDVQVYRALRSMTGSHFKLFTTLSFKSKPVIPSKVMDWKKQVFFPAKVIPSITGYISGQ